MFVPSVVVLPPGPPHHGLRPLSGNSHLSAMPRPKSSPPPAERRQAVVTRRQTTSNGGASSDWNREIQVPYEHVRGHSSAGLSANPRGDALYRKSAPAQNAHEARRWPMTSRRRPHRHAREDRVNGSRNILKSNTRNNCGSKRM